MILQLTQEKKLISPMIPLWAVEVMLESSKRPTLTPVQVKKEKLTESALG